MVYSFKICLLHATRRAIPRSFIKCFSLGLNAGYEKKHIFVARDSGVSDAYF